MGFFDWLRTGVGQREPAPTRMADPSGAELAALTARVERVERDFKVIEVEWNDMFDRFRRLLGKIAKRAEREEDASQSREDAPQPTHAAGRYEEPVSPIPLHHNGSRSNY